MKAQELRLPWGDGETTLALPEGWHLKGVLEPASQSGVPDPGEEVRRSLRSPLGSPRLSDLVEEGMAVTLVIDDLSRPTPVDLLLPAVLEELRRGGARREEVVLVTALGVHRRMSEEEVSARIGGDLLGGSAGRTTTVTMRSDWRFWASQSAGPACWSTAR